jgi:exopolysaccharide production protein ExoQ
MHPNIASIVFTIGILGLFYCDWDKKHRVSGALWIPIAWLFFCFSRSFTGWLGLGTPENQAVTYVEGSPIDAAVFEILVVLALIVLCTRGGKLGSVLRANWAILVFFVYAGLSIFWSDYSFVTLKHWIKGIGDLMMVLIVLTEPNVSLAVERIFTRLGFVLLPLSVLFIKYYPQVGRRLTLSWTSEPVGVATQKNGLGELCDAFGLVILWRFRTAYNDRKNPHRKRRLLALGAVFAMVVWLLWMCNSMTSICALSMASIVMLLSTRPAFRRRPAWVHLLIVALLAITIYGLFFQSSGGLIASLGRNPTLTGRTEIWEEVVKVNNNRLIGAGYESFWLGSRLQRMWDAFPGLRLNEAHNGYIEILISLGVIGEVLLAILIVMGYRNVIACLRRGPDFGSLRMALFLSAIITGLTEAAFRMMGPPWIIFLLATAAPVYVVSKAGGRKRVRRQSPLSTNVPAIVHEEVPAGYRLGHNFARADSQIDG